MADDIYLDDELDDEFDDIDFDDELDIDFGDDVDIDLTPLTGPFDTIIKNKNTITKDTEILISDNINGVKINAKDGTYENVNDKRKSVFEKVNQLNKKPEESDVYGSYFTSIGGDNIGVKEKIISPKTPPYVPQSSSYTSGSYTIPTEINNLEYIDKPINPNVYYDGEFKKTKLILHWTAGWGNVNNIIRGWEGRLKTKTEDWARHVCTSWYLDGILQSSSKLRPENDGVLYRLYDDKKHWSIHSSAGKSIHQTSIGIEIANIGWLDKRGNDYYTYVNTKLINDPNLIYDHYKTYGTTFKGKKYFQKLSDKQLETLEKWIISMANLHNIQIQKNFDTFFKTAPPGATNKDANGLFMHIHYKKAGKWDLPPQPEFIDMLKRIVK